MRAKQQPTTGQLTGFPGEVAREIAALVNQHGVRARMPDGRHVLLFNGKTGTPPLKVSAARPSTTSLRYLREWAGQNVRGYRPAA